MEQARNFSILSFNGHVEANVELEREEWEYCSLTGWPVERDLKLVKSGFSSGFIRWEMAWLSVERWWKFEWGMTGIKGFNWQKRNKSRSELFVGAVAWWFRLIMIFLQFSLDFRYFSKTFPCFSEVHYSRNNKCLSFHWISHGHPLHPSSSPGVCSSLHLFIPTEDGWTPPFCLLDRFDDDVCFEIKFVWLGPWVCDSEIIKSTTTSTPFGSSVPERLAQRMRRERLNRITTVSHLFLLCLLDWIELIDVQIGDRGKVLKKLLVFEKWLYTKWGGSACSLKY